MSHVRRSGRFKERAELFAEAFFLRLGVGEIDVLRPILFAVRAVAVAVRVIDEWVRPDERASGAGEDVVRRAVVAPAAVARARHAAQVATLLSLGLSHPSPLGSFRAVRPDEVKPEMSTSAISGCRRPAPRRAALVTVNCN